MSTRKPENPKVATSKKTKGDLLLEIDELRAQLEGAQATLQAIQNGGVDALVVYGAKGETVCTLQWPDYPYGVLSEVMNEGVVTLDNDANIISCNCRFAQFLRLMPEDVLGLSLIDFVINPDRFKLMTFLKRLPQTGGTMTTVLSPTGAPLTVNLSARPFDLEGMQAICVVATDLTESIAATETRLQLASVVENSNDAIISETFDNIIRSWNAAAEAMYGYTAEEAIDRPMSLIVPPDRMAELTAIADQVCGGQRVTGFDTVRITNDGRKIHVSLTVSPVLDAQRNVVGMSTIAREITERKRTEAQLEKRLRYLEEMVQQRTRELRNKSDALEAANEDLEVQREKLRVANEELHTKREELEVAKKELEARDQKSTA